MASEIEGNLPKKGISLPYLHVLMHGVACGVADKIAHKVRPARVRTGQSLGDKL